MRSKEEIQKDIKRLASRSLWIGIVFGLLLGLALGFAIGYSQVGNTVVVPLSQGITT